MISTPRLIVLCGLPGAGKSRLAEDVCRALGVPVLSVDPIEAALLRSGICTDQPVGLAAYVVAEDLAAAQLALGVTVVIDAVNDVEPARDQWRNLAARHDVSLTFIEVRCSDPEIHRTRLSNRRRNLGDFREPSWESVQARRSSFENWGQRRLVVDSLDQPTENLAAALLYLEAD